MNATELRLWEAEREDPAKRQVTLFRLAEENARREAQELRGAVGELTDAVGQLTSELSDQLAGVQRVMASLADGMVSLARRMATVQKMQLAGLAYQQEILRRDDLQAYVEEFIFRFRKVVRLVEEPPPWLAPEGQMLLLEGMLGRVQAEGIDTPMIRGVENKERFAQCVEASWRHHARLAALPEVRRAIERAEEQQSRKAAEAAYERRRQDEERQNQLEAQLRLASLEDEEDRLWARRDRIKREGWSQPRPGPASPHVGVAVRPAGSVVREVGRWSGDARLGRGVLHLYWRGSGKASSARDDTLWGCSVAPCAG